MKNLLLIIILINIACLSKAQSVGIGTSTPDPSSKLDITSDTSGILIPRMSTSQRDSILDPATGLLVFVTTDSAFYFYDGSAWRTLNSRTKHLVDSDSDTRVEVEKTPDDDKIRFTTRNNEIMVIDANGRIGIGDPAPEEALTLRAGNFLQTPVNPILISSLNIGDSPESVCVSGRYAYVVESGSDSMKVIDVSNPEIPVIVGGLPIGTSPSHITVSGRYAYMIDLDSDDLKVIDIGNPASPELAGSLNLGATPHALGISGHFAYIVFDGSQGLRVIDVTDPRAPALHGALHIDLGAPRSIFVYEHNAYVISALSKELIVIDITNPAAPFITGDLVTGLSPTTLYVSGKFAYIIDHLNGLVIVDVSDPGMPAVVGNLPMLHTRSIIVSGRYAYVGTLSKLNVIDIADPTTPVLLGTHLGGVTSIYVSGRFAYGLRLSGDEFKVFDLSGAEVTTLIAHSMEAGNIQVHNDIKTQGQLQVAGSIVAGGMSSAGDVGVRGSIKQIAKDPVMRSSLGIGPNPTKVQVAGDLAFIVDQSDNDLKIVDVSKPDAPALRGSIPLFATPKSVCVSGRYAYLTSSGVGNLKIIDVSNPTSPGLTGALTIGTDPSSIYVSGPVAYIVDRDSEDLKIVDVVDPSAPKLIGSLGLSSAPSSVFVSGRYAYVTDQSANDIKVIDINLSGSPVLVGSLILGINPLAVYVSGTYAYVVDPSSRDFRIVDVSDPTTPVQSGVLTFGSSSQPFAVHVSGRYAYVADMGTDELIVVDVGEPTAPRVSGRLSMGINAVSVGVSGPHAYVVGQGSNNLKVVDISGLESVSVTAHSMVAGNVHVKNDIVVAGELQVTSGVNIGAGGLYAEGSIGTRGNIQATNRIGIGLALPNEQLEIAGEGRAFFGDGGGATRKGLLIDGVQGTTAARLEAYNYETQTGMNLVINTAGGGNVGIGTATPTSQLHTTGSVRFSNFGAGTLQTDANGNISVSSDERLKDIKGAFTPGLDAILRIDPITYSWRSFTGFDDAHVYSGFSAQNVQQVIPQAVGVDADGYLTLSDRPIIAALVNAMQELHTENQQLRIELNDIKVLTSDIISFRDELRNIPSTSDQN